MRKFLLFLGVLLLTLGLSAGVVNATLWTVMDADHTYIDYQDELGNSILKIDDDDGVTVTGGFSAGGDFTVTDPTSGDNAVYGLINAGEAWTTSDNVVGIRGKAVITAAGSTGSATGVWAGLEITSASVQRFGLQVGLNVEAYSSTICLPNAVLYIQSLPYGANSDFSAVPYLVFSETVTNGAGSHILFEVGHMWANTIPDIGEDELFYNDTLQIAVNEQAGTRTAFFIPLSTDSGTFTFEYPTILSNTLTVGTAGTSFNVVFYSDSSGTHLTWDADTEKRLELTNARFIMGTSGIGIPVTSTDSYAMEVHTEPGSALTAYTSTFGIRSRYHIDTAQTNIVTIEAMDARLRVKQNIAGGVHCGIQGYIEASGSPAFAGGLNAAGSFTLELQSGTTITGGTYMCGVNIDSASHTDLDVNDTTYVGLRIWAGDGPPVKEDWEYGIIMDDGDVGVGIQIGDCTTGITLDGTITTGLNIASGATTGVAIAAASTAGIAISGANATGIVMTGTYSTAGISIATDMAAYNDYCIYIAAECDDTSGNTILPLYVTADIDGTGGNGRAAEFLLAPTATMGDWGNAVKGYLNLDNSAGSIGLLSAVCAETKLPNEAMSGTLTVLELELVAPDSGLIYGGPLGSLSFIYARVSGTQKTVFDDSGNLMTLAGLTDEINHLFYDNTLRIVVSGTTWYLPMSSAQASYTSAYPIALTNTLTTGSSGSGHDINFWGDTANQKFFWDASQNRLTITHTELVNDGGGAYNAGVKITATNNLALVSNRLCGLSVDINPKAATDVYRVIGAEICTYLASDTTASGGPSVIGLFVETQGGTSIAHDWRSLYVYSAPGQAPSGEAVVVRLEHNSAVATESFIDFVDSSTCPDFLWRFGPNADETAWSDSGSLTVGAGGWLKVRVGTSTRYIQLHDTN